MKLSEIASRIGARLDGPDVEIHSVSGIEEAGPGQLTFVANPRYVAALKTTKASAVIVSDDCSVVPVTTLRCKNPYLAFARALELFYHSPSYQPGIHPTASIDPTATIGSNASIGPFVCIDKDVTIGDNCVLLPHVVIYRGAQIGNGFFAHAHAVVREDCRLGDNVLLQNGAIVGSDGFGFAQDGKKWQKIAQSGPAVLGSDVEVQANACIDRATVGETRIGNGSKVDNLVQVGHACEVGENTLLCAQVGLAGSTVVGNNVILAGQVGIAGHCHIGDGAIVTAQSGVHADVAPNSMVSGSPVFDHKQWMKAVTAFMKLPELAKAVRVLASEKNKVGAAGEQ